MKEEKRQEIIDEIERQLDGANVHYTKASNHLTEIKKLSAQAGAWNIVSPDQYNDIVERYSHNQAISYAIMANLRSILEMERKAE